MSIPTLPVTIRDLVVRYYTDEAKPQTIAEISRKFGIGRETVREHLIRAGVPRRAQTARGSRDEAMMAEAARRYLDGETLWSIANDLGKTATTVRAWLIDAGVERRRPGVSVDGENLQETIRLYESGLTIEEVAAEQSMHPWTVRKRLVNAGVPRRARGRRARPGAESANMPLVDAEAAERQIRRSQEAIARATATPAYACAASTVMLGETDRAAPLGEVIGGSLDDVILGCVER